MVNAGILRILPPPAAPGRQAEPSQLCKTLGRDRDGDYRHAGSNCHSAILLRNLTGPRPVHWSSRKQAYFISTATPRQSCLSSLGCTNAAGGTAAMSEMSISQSSSFRYSVLQPGKKTLVTEELLCFISRLPIFSTIPDFNGLSRLCWRNALVPTALARTLTSTRLSDGLITWCVPLPDNCASRPPTSKPPISKNHDIAPTANASATEESKHESFSPETARSNLTKSGAIAHTVGGVFSPNRPAQRLTHRGYSLETVTVAVICSEAAGSFEEAARLLKAAGPHREDPPRRTEASR